LLVREVGVKEGAEEDPAGELLELLELFGRRL
jgi:hypothetical protein